MFTLYYKNEKLKNFLKKINFKYPKVNKLNPILKTILNNNNIIFEKKKRYYTYNKLNYLLENYTYFDFFTNEIFNILKYTKYLIYLLKKSNINLNILNIIFFILNKKQNLTIFTNQSNKIKNLKNSSKFINKILLKILTISYSKSLNNFFEIITNQSLLDYKTPVITLENILINLLNFYPFIKNNQIYLYLIRYKLLKRLHKQENILHNYIKKNNHFFLYLIKKTSIHLLKDISINNLNNLITVYRNNLIFFSLKSNLNKLLQNEYYFYLLNK